MPDNDDLRMNQNETLNCKLALMGVWTEACREAAAYFGVNPDGSGNFSSVTQAQAGSTAGTLAVDGISADEMTSRLAASLVEHFPDKTDIITGDPAAAKAYVKQYVVDLANHQALAQARTNSKLFHKQLNRAAVGLADEHGPYAPVPAAEEEFDMCVPLMDGTIEENSEEVAEFSRELDRTGIRYKFSELAAAGSAKVQTCLEFMSRDIKAVQAACTRAAQNISARGRAFADKVKCVPFVPCATPPSSWARAMRRSRRRPPRTRARWRRPPSTAPTPRRTCPRAISPRPRTARTWARHFRRDNGPGGHNVQDL